MHLTRGSGVVPVLLTVLLRVLLAVLLTGCGTSAGSPGAAPSAATSSSTASPLLVNETSSTSPRPTAAATSPQASQVPATAPATPSATTTSVPATSNLPLRKSARDIGTAIRMAAGPDAGLYVWIPDRGGSVLALLNAAGRAGPGGQSSWPGPPTAPCPPSPMTAPSGSCARTGPRSQARTRWAAMRDSGLSRSMPAARHSWAGPSTSTPHRVGWIND